MVRELVKLADLLRRRQTDGGRAPTRIPDGRAAPGAPAAGNGIAVAAMVLGIVGIVFAILIAALGLLLGILAVVFGVIGTNKVDRGETAQNRGQARAGFFTGIVAIVLAIATGSRP